MDGSIDWWCPGRFDADPVFYRLTDPDHGGFLRVGPGGSGSQRYAGDSLVVRTVLVAGETTIELTDLVCLEGRRIVRIVEALRGQVSAPVVVEPGRYGRPARDVHAWSAGIAFDGVVVRTGCDMNGRAGLLPLVPGERAVITVDIEPDDGSPLPEPLTVGGALDLVDRARTAWSSRVVGLSYEGSWPAEVRRSVLTLLGLTYARVGTLVEGVPTAGAWLRDALGAIDVYGTLGLVEEAETVLRWVRNVLAWSDLPLPSRFGVVGDAVDDGDTDAGEGLDVYGDFAAFLTPEHAEMWPDVLRIGEWLTDGWTARGRLTSSKLASWSFLEWVGRLETSRNPLSLTGASLRLAARDVVAWLEAHALAVDGGLRSDSRAAELVDASLLVLPRHNPWPHEMWRAERTVDRVLRRLGDGAFVVPHDSSFRPDEDGDVNESPAGPSMEWSFTAVEALARLGRWDDANPRMEELLASDAWRTSLPRADAHVAMLRAALALAHGPR